MLILLSSLKDACLPNSDFSTCCLVFVSLCHAMHAHVEGSVVVDVEVLSVVVDVDVGVVVVDSVVDSVVVAERRMLA